MLVLDCVNYFGRYPVGWFYQYWLESFSDIPWDFPVCIAKWSMN